MEFRNFEEDLDQNQFNLDFLKRLAFECYRVDKRSLEAFSGHYYWSSRDWYTGELSLKEIIERNIYLKKLNGEEKHFNFLINFCIVIF